METLMTGVGILAILLGWRYAWRPTALDDARDRLFDLRESVRAEFMARGWGLDHAAYKSLRDLINGHLRYTEAVRFSRIVAFHAATYNKPEVAEHMKALVDGMFVAAGPEIEGYARKVRVDAAMTVLAYVIVTSPFALALVAFGAAKLAAARVSDSAGRASFPWRRTATAAALSSALFASVTPAHASPEELQSFMEGEALTA